MADSNPRTLTRDDVQQIIAASLAEHNMSQRKELENLIESHGVTRRLSSGQKWDVAVIVGATIALAVTLLGFGGLEIVQKAAKIAATDIKAADVATELQGNSVLKANLGEYLSKPPAGAVMAFDLSEKFGCPGGWSVFTPAGGRMLVGAGQHQNTDRNNKPLQVYQSLQENPSVAVGGVESVALSLDQMPSHNHNTRDDNRLVIVNGADTNDGPLKEDQDRRKPNLSDASGLSSAGGIGGVTQPHNNMPPYLALYFCKKDAPS